MAAGTDGGAQVDLVAIEVVHALNEGAGEPLFKRFGPTMQKAMPVEKTRAFVTQIHADKGHLAAPTRQPGGSELGAVYLIVAERGELRMSLNVDRAGSILGFSIQNKPTEPPVVRSDLTTRLPMRGAWFIAWGGSTQELNQHVLHASQRRAVDLLMLSDAGVSYRTDGARNDDYLAYGQPILAVADGIVEQVVDGVTDNAPGKMNPYYTPGNMVVLRHGDGGVFSSYAHLKPGLQLRVGAKVKQGAVLGRCGNSGNSSEPHLHFQLQDGPLFERAWGIEPIFRDVTIVRDGGTSVEAHYTWLKGDVVVAP